jgi:hypothetical protein
LHSNKPIIRATVQQLRGDLSIKIFIRICRLIL